MMCLFIFVNRTTWERKLQDVTLLAALLYKYKEKIVEFCLHSKGYMLDIWNWILAEIIKNEIKFLNLEAYEAPFKTLLLQLHFLSIQTFTDYNIPYEDLLLRILKVQILNRLKFNILEIIADSKHPDMANRKAKRREICVSAM